MEASVYRDAINRLISNPELGRDEILMDLKSNCHGTTLYIFGAENIALDYWLRNQMMTDRKGDRYVHFSRDRPGYVDGRLMWHLLTESGYFERLSERKVGSVQASYLTEDNLPTYLLHTAIYLGDTKDCKAVFFEQEDYGEPFQFRRGNGSVNERDKQEFFTFGKVTASSSVPLLF